MAAHYLRRCYVHSLPHLQHTTLVFVSAVVRQVLVGYCSGLQACFWSSCFVASGRLCCCVRCGWVFSAVRCVERGSFCDVCDCCLATIKYTHTCWARACRVVQYSSAVPAVTPWSQIACARVLAFIASACGSTVSLWHHAALFVSSRSADPCYTV
jgi:hypothetical protein